MKDQKMHFSELVTCLGEDYQGDWRISPKIGNKKHEYKEYISPQPLISQSFR